MGDPVSLVASPVVKVISSLTADFIKEQYHLVYGVEDEVEKLERNMSAIQATLTEIEGSLSDTSSKPLQDWLVKLKDAALDVQDVLEIYATKALMMSRKKRRLLFSPFLRREAALNIKKIVNRINEISKERISFHRAPKTQTDPRTGDAVIKNYGLQQTGSSRDSSDVYGRDEDKEKIVKWIMSTEFDVEGEVCVLPIIGMAGLGKTTLAQLVYNDERVLSHFEHRIWIDVTIRFSLERIGKEIIEGVTGEHYPLTSWGSIVSRVDGLLEGKLFLLVLDDLWNERFIDWEKLYQLLRKGMTGSRVVITSRISGISRTVAARRTHFLDFLQEEACWSVFANIAFSGDQGCLSLRDEIREIGREIVQKCNGLPLAVTGIAILLRGVTEINQWQRVRRDGIWETELKNAANGETYILPALRFSYDHLPPHLKQCFAYCCIFPKGHIFYKGDLIKLWMAEGFVDLSGPGLPEETGSDYFKELRARSFFHPVSGDDDREGYRIHNFLHDLATWVSQESAHVIKNDETPTLSSKCRYVSFVSKHVQEPASHILKVTKIRTILLPTKEKRDFGQVLDKMFNTLEYLRVLDLSSSDLEVLPESIAKLVLLQYLDLSRTEIRKLPGSVCSLIKLQTLKLIECLWLSKLPDGLSRLTNLRHLELDDIFWYNCSSLPPGIENLTNLQNLHSFPVGHGSGVGLEQLQRLKYLTGKLCISQLENGANAADANLREKEDLQELVLKWSEGNASPRDPIAEERVLGDLQPHSKIQGIQIYHYNGSQFPTWMANETSLQNLSKVSLSYCINIKSLSLGLLCHVTEFYIKGMPELEEWTEAVYLNLKLLQISKCPKLRSLPSSFQNLKSMKIKGCDILKTLPLTPSLNSLILIDNIALDKMQDQAMSATEKSNLDGGEAASVLKIVNCPKITALWHPIQPNRLEIRNCSLLKTLPFTEHSTHLKHVVIDRCSQESVVEAIPSSTSVESLVLSNITKLIFLPVSLQLPGLKALYIHECEIFTSMDVKSFTSLVLLSVSNCPKLEILVSSDNGFPISLEHLSVNKCSNLESIGPQKCLSHLAVLKDLYLEDCPKLKSFPEDGPPSSLKHLHIRGCPLISQSLSNGGSCSPWMAQVADLESDFT